MDISEWGEKDVLRWLNEAGFSELAPYFQGHDIDGEALPALTEDLLKEMGIEEFDLRERLVAEIRFEISKNQSKERRRNTIKPLSTPVKKGEPKRPAAKNLVEIYSEGATAKENDSFYTLANRHGFLDEGEEKPKADESEQDFTKKIIEREKKWQKMMKRNNAKPPTLDELEKQPEFRKRVYKGIPYSWRIQVWKLLTVGEVDDRKHEIYEQMLQKPTSDADANQIDLDINRTLRNHVNYKQRYGKGQKRLFDVLRAYANYNPEVGFCQGMATVAAFLLIHCDDETTFWIMDTLVSNERFRLQGLWIAGFPSLMESFFLHEKLFKYHLPKLWKHFKNQKIHPSSYATRWYMTVFLCLPFHTCLRVWDIFLLEGFDLMFFLAIGSLEYFQAELLSKDFEGIMEFLGQLPKQEVDDDKLVQLLVRVLRKTYSSLPGKANSLQVLRSEYKKILAEGGSPFGDY